MRRALAAALAAAVLLAGCAAPAATPGCAERTVERLYFGLATPAGEVGEDEWRRFVDAEITPRFPDGLTIVEARGQWRGADGRVLRESSRVVEIVHDGEAEARLAEIVARYKARFRQESVLRTSAPARACF